MNTGMKRTNWLRAIALASTIAPLSACFTMRPVATPQEFIPSARPDRIWVTRADNSRLVIEGPRLLGDTLVGWVRGQYQEILLPQTRWMSVRQPAPRRTALLVAGATVVGASLLYFLASNGPSSSMTGGEDPSNPSSLRFFYPRGLR
jgi:hypothetical protein